MLGKVETILDQLKTEIERFNAINHNDIGDLKQKVDLLWQAKGLLTEANDQMEKYLWLELWLYVLEAKHLGVRPELPQRQLQKLPSVANSRRTSLRTNETQRDEIANEVCWGIFECEKETKQGLLERGVKDSGVLWPIWLVGLVNAYGNMRLQDFFDRVSVSSRIFATWNEPARSIFLKNSEQGQFELYIYMGNKLLTLAESNRQKEKSEIRHKTKLLSEELGELNPPLTWRETYDRFVCFLQFNEETKLLRELDTFLGQPKKRVCNSCQRYFMASKYNPGRFVCPKCSTKRRVQKWREKNSDNSRSLLE